ncbi:predicted protein [Histoplasma capsulatum G186AR]|uniref:Uncharacterized protein n=1 Tax=Ajellomyces capsulatus (strain G186AR / H82 / ATCC MYA-2454 / RMSCC 2432) TaxID=447093 RepID=C0NQG1_AJECG|nr:uncharacterized protein HCBG_05749 [Histoplasma capsulatum G186AR]EEH06433.1 predicted protein [Histoplasma capsulatum G186AR]
MECYVVHPAFLRWPGELRQIAISRSQVAPPFLPNVNLHGSPRAFTYGATEDPYRGLYQFAAPTIVSSLVFTGLYRHSRPAKLRDFRTTESPSGSRNSARA